ncbi:HIT family protein [Corynebacterium jeikeium]|uniref:HIT family protein n=1 Tax=Corynebacterium jeikeium TaxID=38289 RepID=UPI000DA326CB|nr:HIT domain-containing protein [Corynebacterium jeikeium]SQI20887.1 Hit (histidine triad) family protein [Corynebacterium jeikeium]
MEQQPDQQTEPYVDSGVGSQPDLQGGLERLWAPYRSQYIAKSNRSADPFATLPELSDEEALIVARGESVYCVLNLYPYNPGHMLVIPYRQVADYTELSAEETAELAEFTKIALKTLRAVSKPEAVNVGLNLGKASGGSIPTHLHQHIVPRWAGDANFMTVMTGTKVLPQTLRETRALLAEAWKSVTRSTD